MENQKFRQKPLQLNTEGIEILEEEKVVGACSTQKNKKIGKKIKEKINSPINNDLVSRLVEIFEEINKKLGPGYSESVYENAIMVALRHHCISYQNQVIIPIKYMGHCIGYHKPDFIIENYVIVEIKSTKWTASLKQSGQMQLARYINTIDIPVGMLINFGVDAVFSCTIKY